MIIGEFDTDQRVLVVAEIGNNHEGSCALAAEMIAAAAQAGVDAVKFQTFRTEHYVSPRDESRFARLKSFELTEADFGDLRARARQHDLLFLSTPFDLHSARFLDGLVPAFKIASGDNTFYPLLELLAKTGKPLILSSGLAELEQIQYAKSLIECVWRELGIEQELAVLHCVSSYPVPPAQANLAAIARLKARLDCTIGYSDHTLGVEACVCAVAAGARIVEKHFTLDKHHSDFRDHQLSADPDELAEIVLRIRRVTELLGDGEKVVQECERSAVQALRRSIAAARDLSAGAVVCWEDLTWLRPAGGLQPGKEHLVLGKTLHKPVRQGDRITLDCLDG